MQNKVLIIALVGLMSIQSNCSKKGDGNTTPPPVVPPTNPPVTNEVDFWLTKGDQSVLLQKQSTFPKITIFVFNLIKMLIET